MGLRYNVIGYNGHSIQQSRFLGHNVTFSRVFCLIITDLQYNSQNVAVPMGPKQPGPIVILSIAPLFSPLYFLPCLRFSSYYFLATPWLSLLIDSLHTLTFGLMWATAASFANAIAPPDCVATLQALISGIFNSLGRALGSSMGGILIHHFGYRLAFLTGSFIAFILGTIYTAIVIGRSTGNRANNVEV